MELLNNGGVQGQIYAARALTNMSADPAVQDQIVALGGPHSTCYHLPLIPAQKRCRRFRA